MMLTSCASSTGKLLLDFLIVTELNNAYIEPLLILVLTSCFEMSFELFKSVVTYSSKLFCVTPNPLILISIPSSDL